MTYTTLDGTWSEYCFIDIVAQSGTAMAFQAITETIDIDIGEKGFDSIATLGGARLVKFTPMGDITITFEAYPIYAGTMSGATGEGYWDLLNTQDTAQPLQVLADKVRTKYRIAILWTDDPVVTTGDSVVAIGSTGYRIVAADGYFVSYKESMTDGIKKATVVFKVPPFDSSGSANFKVESCETTEALTVLEAYTSTTKW